MARDHRTVVRAGYGRFHEGLYTSVYDFMNTSALTPKITARVLGPEIFQETSRTATTAVAIDEHLAHAFVDQYHVGAEREVLPEIYADVFNLTNQGVPLALQRDERSGASFGQPNGWAQPRSVQVAVRVKF